MNNGHQTWIHDFHQMGKANTTKEKQENSATLARAHRHTFAHKTHSKTQKIANALREYVYVLQYLRQINVEAIFGVFCVSSRTLCLSAHRLCVYVRACVCMLFKYFDNNSYCLVKVSIHFAAEHEPKSFNNWDVLWQCSWLLGGLGGWYVFVSECVCVCRSNWCTLLAHI